MSHSTFYLKPLLHYSETQERTQLFDDTAVPEVSMSKKRAKPRKQLKKKRGTASGHKLTLGKLALKVKGYSGVHRLAAAQLIKFVPLKSIKAAARKVLVQSGVQKTKKKSSKKSGGRAKKKTKIY